MKALDDLVRTFRLRSASAALALAACVLLTLASPAVAATYDPLDVIPYDTYRASSSMTVADVQTFLEALPGPLKSVVAADHNGKKKTAARIIWEAARSWNMNPKIILATLQKEQSLLTVSNSGNHARLLKAMGCGVYGIDPITGKTKNRFPGFGRQVWNGARLLSTYEVTYGWFPGATRTVHARRSITATKTVDGEVVEYARRISYRKTIRPRNASTFALYIYTPYYPQKLVWDVYVRYFGDPRRAPRLRPVYRFRNRSTGAYLYTISEGTRYSLKAKSSHTWSYGGTAFSIDTSSPVNAKPLYRLRNTRTHRYQYTASTRMRDAFLSVRPRVWVSSGTVGRVSTTAGTGAPIYRLEHKRTHGILLTRYASTKKRLTAGRRASFRYKGVAFYVGHSAPTTTPVGPSVPATTPVGP